MTAATASATADDSVHRVFLFMKGASIVFMDGLVRRV